MYQSPTSTIETTLRNSSESKKRKSITQYSDDTSVSSGRSDTNQRPGVVIVSGGGSGASPITSDSPTSNLSITHAEGLIHKIVKSIPSSSGAGVTDQLDSDVATEDGSNTTKEAVSRMSSDIGSPAIKAEEIILTAENISNKRPRFSEEFHSPLFARQRSYTFSTADDYSKQPALNKNPFDPLSWLASIAERENEVDAAKSLFELSHDASRDLAEEEENDGEEEEEDGDAEDDEEGEADNEDSQYVDPYLVNRSSFDGKVVGNGGKAASGASTSQINNDLEDVSDSEFAAVSYLQNFQQKAKLWKNNPFSEEMSHDKSTMDPLELLKSSADLVASPLSRKSLHLQQFNDLREVNLFPFPISNNSRTINHSIPPHEVHYLDTMKTDIQNMTHSSKFTGRARSASMSILEGTSSSSLNNNPAFDNPALARIKESFGKKTGIPLPPKGEGYIGIYSPEERKARIQRFLEKRKHRMWAKKVKYDVRKNFADSRIRVKGRFVKKDEEKAAMIIMQNK